MTIKLIEEILESKESHIRDVGNFACGAQSQSLEEYIKETAFLEIVLIKKKFTLSNAIALLLAIMF